VKNKWVKIVKKMRRENLYMKKERTKMKKKKRFS